MAYVEQYIFGETKKITEITGIDKILLPPAEKLRIKRQSLLAQEMEKLLQHFNFYLDFPVS